MNKTIQNRQQNQKKALIEQLKKTPIVQVACEKFGIGRATYYRWRKEDHDFAKESCASIQEGVELMSDMAESQLLSAIKAGNLTAIIFWLKHRHTSYKQRVEVTSKANNQELTEEEQKLLKQALKMGGLISNTTSKCKK